MTTRHEPKHALERSECFQKTVALWPVRMCYGLWHKVCSEISVPGFNILVGESWIRRSFSINSTRQLFRAIWHPVIFVFIALTVLCLAMVFEGYAERPIRTSTEKIYPYSVEFPMVVICNTMPYRVSALHPQDHMHVALAAIYEGTRPNMKLIYENGTIRETLEVINDTRTFYENIAHQKEDMIVSCRWHNSNCSANEFVPVITEQGVCYAFNADPLTRRTVNTAGRNYGLELVINAATYEEMNGPYNGFGTLLGFIAQGYPPTIARAVNTHIGDYTAISLAIKQVDYVEGENCGIKHLQFFDTYTREACMLEKTFEFIKEKCGCYPFMVDRDRIGETEYCNLVQHLGCAQTYIDWLINRKRYTWISRFFWFAFLEETPITYDDVYCPSHCEEFVYSPMVSSSAVAWDRMRNSFQHAKGRIEGQLRQTWETSKRFQPKYNSSTRAIFMGLQGSIDRVNRMLDNGRNLRVSIPKVVPLPVEPHFESNLKIFKFKTMPNIKEEFATALNGLATVINSISSVLSNARFYNMLLHPMENSNAPTLLAWEGGSPWSRASTILPEDIFAVIDSKLYLNALPLVLNQLSDLLDIKNELLQHVQETFYDSSEDTIMSENEAQKLNQTVRLFLLLGSRHKDRSQPNERGCFQQSTWSAINSGRNNRYDGIVPESAMNATLLLDVYLCLLHYFSSPNTRVAVAPAMADFVFMLPSKAYDASHQSEICHQMVCDFYRSSQGRDETAACNRKTHLELLRALHDSLQRGAIYCNRFFARAKSKMEDFLAAYAGSTLKDYLDAVNHAELYGKESVRIHHLFSKQVFMPLPRIDWLSGNMSAYVRGDLSYAQFSLNIIDDIDAVLDSKFNYAMLDMKGDLDKALHSLANMKSALANLKRIDAAHLPQASLRHKSHGTEQAESEAHTDYQDFQNFQTDEAAEKETILLDLTEDKRELEEILDLNEEIIVEDNHSMLSSANETWSFTPANGTRFDNTTSGIFRIVTQSLLWRENLLNQSLLEIEAFEEVLEDYLQEINDDVIDFSRTYRAVVEDCKNFKAKITTDTAFFQRNFMVVNVYMQEISKEIVTQEYAYTFWNMIADLGGTACFWFSLGMINAVEFVDIVIRYFYGHLRATYKGMREERENKEAFNGVPKKCLSDDFDPPDQPRLTSYQPRERNDKTAYDDAYSFASSGSYASSARQQSDI